MEALFMHIGAQPAAAGAGQSVQPVARIPEAAGKGSFQQLLRQIIGTGGSADAVPAAGIPAAAGGMLNLQAIATLLSQPSVPEELAAAIERLLAALETDSPLFDRLAEEPPFAEWLAEAAALLWPGASPSAPFDAEAPSFAEDGQPAGIREVLSLLVQRLKAGEADERIVSLGEKLKAVVDGLVQTPPATALPDGDESARTADPKPEPSAAAVRPQPAAVVQTDEAAKNGEGHDPFPPVARVADGSARAESLRLLDRLAHMKPNVAVLSMAVQSEGDAAAFVTAGELRPDMKAAPAAGEAPQQAAPAGVQPSPLAQAPQTPARTPDVPAAVVHARQFAEEMAELVVKQFTVVRTGPVSEARITLMPEHLGQLDVKISVQDGTVTALFAAETAGARDMLEMQLPMLRAALQQQGFQVDRLVVSHQQAAGMTAGYHQDGRGHQTGNQERRQGGTRETAVEIEPIEFPLPDIEATYGDEIPFRYGSTFHATA